MLRRLYHWTIEKAAHPHAAFWLAFFCFIEASFFPIPPHPLLGLMCLAEPKKSLRFAMIATVSSVMGGLLGYAIGWGLFDVVGEQLLGAIGLAESFPAAQCTFNRYGVAAVIFAGATPVPFKLLTITAGFMEMALVPFVLASFIGRLLMFGSIGVMFRFFGSPIKRFVDRYLELATAVLLALVIGGFVVAGALGSPGEGADPCAAPSSTEVGEA